MIRILLQVMQKARRGAVLALALVMAAGLSACSTATPYQPDRPGQSVSGGYSEIKLAPDRYRVTFEGNRLTSRETVEGYLLYRAAELTLVDGYDGFSIIERNVERRTETYYDPDPFYRPWYGPSYAYWRPYWRYYHRPYGWRSWDPYRDGPFWDQGLSVRTDERYEVTAEILLHRGPVPPGDPRIFSAQGIIYSLGPRIKRPE